MFGLFSQLKILAVVAAVIVVVAYLGMTRHDAQRAAAAKVEIDDLVEVNKVKQQQLELSNELHQSSIERQRATAVKLQEAQANTLAAISRIDQLESQGAGEQCRLDCILSEELQD